MTATTAEHGTTTPDGPTPYEPQSARRPAAPRVLAGAAAIGFLWPTWIGVQQLQVGRILAIVLFASIAFDLATRRTGGFRPVWAAAAYAGSFVALTVWNALNGAIWGCLCSGSAQAMGDTAILLVLASVVMLYATTRETLLVLGAAAGAVLVAGLLSIAGAGALHANVLTVPGRGARLDGVYGNPNGMGTAFALALPVAAVGVVRLRGRLRLAAAACAVALGVLLLVTFSRGSLLAGGAGVAVALVLAVPALRSRRVAIGAAVAVPLLLVGFIASPFYRDQRVSADFGGRASADNLVDHSGWRSHRLGPITDGGGKMANPPGTNSLELTATAAEQGVAYAFDSPFDRGRWSWELELSAPGEPRARLEWVLVRYDQSVPARGEASVGENLSPRVARFNVDARAEDYFVLYIWTDRPTRFRVDRLQTQGQPPVATTKGEVSTKLLGTDNDALHAIEGQYIESRTTGLRLALDAFAEQPLRGIGSDAFPDFADRHAEFGRLPTHNTYAQVAAELGLVGLLLLLLGGASVAWSAARSRADREVRAIATGVTVAGAVNLLFINALSSPAVTLPLIVAMAALAGWAGPAPRRHRSEQRPDVAGQAAG